LLVERKEVSETARAPGHECGNQSFSNESAQRQKMQGKNFVLPQDQEELYQIHATPENFLSKLLLEVYRERG
jgi:hypothetical protein